VVQYKGCHYLPASSAESMISRADVEDPLNFCIMSFPPLPQTRVERPVGGESGNISLGILKNKRIIPWAGETPTILHEWQ